MNTKTLILFLSLNLLACSYEDRTTIERVKAWERQILDCEFMGGHPVYEAEIGPDHFSCDLRIAPAPRDYNTPSSRDKSN